MVLCLMWLYCIIILIPGFPLTLPWLFTKVPDHLYAVIVPKTYIGNLNHIQMLHRFIVQQYFIVFPTFPFPVLVIQLKKNWKIHKTEVYQTSTNKSYFLSNMTTLSVSFSKNLVTKQKARFKLSLRTSQNTKWILVTATVKL